MARCGMWVKGLGICEMWQIVSNIKQNMRTFLNVEDSSPCKLEWKMSGFKGAVIWYEWSLIKSGQSENMKRWGAWVREDKTALCVVLAQVFTTKTHHNKLIWPFVCSCSKSRDSSRRRISRSNNQKMFPK